MTRSPAPFAVPRLPLLVFTLLWALLWFLLLTVSPRAEETALPPVGAADLLSCGPRGITPMPLLSTDVRLTVTAVMVQGVVEQSFVNPDDVPVEALYVFPLPDRAAVHALEMRVGDRKIVATVREKEEARAVYEAAKKEGKKAGLLEHRQGNLFTTAVSGINPGETVRVRIEYAQEAEWKDGEYETVLPLTYTPRYTPRGRGQPLLEPAVLADAAAPTIPRVSVRVRFEGAVSRVDSPTHQLRRLPAGGSAGTEREHLRPAAGSSGPLEMLVTAPRVAAPGSPAGSEGQPEARPAVDDRTAGTDEATPLAGDGTNESDAAGTPSDFPADRDVVLRWSPPLGPTAAARLFVEDREDGRYGLLTILPPAPGSEEDAGLSSDTVFLVDTSGSMGGPSIEQARAALREALGRVRPGDGYELMRFSDDWSAFRPGFSRAPDAMDEALGWVDSLEAGGGTEMIPALVEALRRAALSEPGRVRRVILLTDGAIGNEDEAFAALAPLLGTTRLHVIGIGLAPNGYLMSRLAHFGHGACEFIRTRDEVKERTGRFLERLDRPVLTELRLDWRGAPPLDAQPERLPDLFAGEPLVVSLSLGLGHPGLRGELVGRSGSGEVRVPIEPAEAPVESGVALRWARARVEGLLESGIGSGRPETVRPEVVSLAEKFTLVTPWTSLVAVEEQPTVEGTPASRRVASALPAGMHPCDGMLPQGGTLWPLLTRVGLVLLGTGVALILMFRPGRA